MKRIVRYINTRGLVNRGLLLNGHCTPLFSRPDSNSFRNALVIRKSPGNDASLCRAASTYSTARNRLRQEMVKARKEYPILLPVLTVATLAALSLLALLAYDEYTRIAPQYAAYPTPVEQRLRLALHYTYIQPDPDQATTYFREALSAAAGVGMNPFSKEVMGIRIRFAQMLENFGRVKSAVDIMNSIVDDCEEKLAEINRKSILVEVEKTEQTDLDQPPSLRPALIRGIIQARVKLASLYSSDYIQDTRMAKQTLSDAITLLVKESTDPETSITEENAANMSMAEIASIFSQMGDLYATTGEESNAVQTYMLALDPLRKACGGVRSCKEVQIFGNIAATMDIAMKKPGAKINGRQASPQSLKAARKAAIAWADQAIATAEKVEPQDRDEICETGLLSAQMTRADLMLDDGNKKESQKIFASLLPTLRQRGLDSLVQVAEDGLKRCSV